MQTVNEDEPLLSSERDMEEYTDGLRYSVVPSADNNSKAATHVVASSLDFDRIVNQYSIQAVRDEWRLPPLPSDGASSERFEMDPTEPSRRKQEKKLFGYTGITATRWILSALAGLLTGLTTNVIVWISGSATKWRSQNIQSLIINPKYGDESVLAVFLSLNLLLALASSLLVLGWVPQAAGSGISAVKAYLNGIRGNQKFTRLSLLIVKILGTILSVTSSLAVGQEGPLIHIGAIMGSGCSKINFGISKSLNAIRDHVPGCIHQTRCLDRVINWSSNELSHFATDAERRDLVSIGASCGFAASFGSPVGGLLFILDDISSYFSKSLLLRMLVANAIGTFCLAVQHGNLSNYSVINLGTYSEKDNSIVANRIEEIPLYILIGVLGGILGGGFCKTFMWIRAQISARLPPPGKGRAKWQLLEVALVSVITSLVLFYLPSFQWFCKVNPDVVNHNGGIAFGLDPTAGMPRKRFFCSEGEVNELANIFFGSRIDAIKRILTDPTQFLPQTLLAVGGAFYVLMTITFGISIPSGIFTPTVLIGAALGGAAGNFFQSHVDSEVTPATFALLGVAALLAGIQRSTVSVAVILVEGTGQIKVLTPAIIVVVVARYVASLIYPYGVFDAVLKIKKMPYLDHEGGHRRYDAIEVGDILLPRCPLEAVSPTMQAIDLVELLEESKHNAFPVVDPTTKKFLGLVRRDQICALLECGVFEESIGGAQAWTRPESGLDKTPLMRWAYRINDDRYEYILEADRPKKRSAERITNAPRFSVISSKKLQLADYSALPTEFALISRNDEGLLYITWLNSEYHHHLVNLGAVMNRGAYCVPHFCPVSKAFSLFTSLGLRHIVVLGGDSGGEVVGVLSRENFMPQNIKMMAGI